MSGAFGSASIHDRALFGPVIHRLGFGQAIECQLLTDCQVVFAGVDEDTYTETGPRPFPSAYLDARPDPVERYDHAGAT